MKRTALITGATKGIGWALAKRFGEGEFDIFITSRNESELAIRKQELNDTFPNIKVYTHAADISQKEGVLSLAKELQHQVNVLDVLINNAGVFSPGSILEEEDGNLEAMIQTNLYSAYHLTRAIIPAIKLSKRGHIINMCSIASFMAYPNGGSYSISKFAMLGFSKVLRAELREHGIGVTSVMPGSTWSNSWSGVDLPRERLMEPEDIAELCWSAVNLGHSAVVEDIVVRPQLGDL